MSNYEVITTALTIIGLVFVVGQLTIGIRSLKAAHERQKKQATIEYLHNIRPVYNQLWNNLQQKFGDDVITEKMVAALVNEHEIRREIKELLSILEHASVGMNTGVFDKDLWYRMSANFLIRLYNRLRAYIKHAQTYNSYAYVEFEGIVKEFEARKATRPDGHGNIKFS